MTNTLAKRQQATPSARFGDVFDNILQTSFRRFFDNNFWDGDTVPSYGQIPVNVREADDRYELDVVAPGLRKEDFSVNVQDNLLTISCEQKQEDQQQKNGWTRNEYQFRSFSRSFSLDQTVNTAEIKASYSDGILRLTLPKNEQAKKVTRRIDIQG